MWRRDGFGWLIPVNAGIFAQQLPTRPIAHRKKKAPAKLTAARILRIWRDLGDRRARLKAEALSDAREARRTPQRVVTVRQASRPPPKARQARRGLTGAQRQLLDLDSDLARIARSVRGWRDLAAVERQSLALAPARTRGVSDLAAEVAETALLRRERWYAGALGAAVERQVKRVLGPWPAIVRARNVLVARKKRRVSGAARDLTALDGAIVAFVEAARIVKQLTSIHARHVKGQMRHGQQLVVQFLLEDYRAAIQAVPTLLRGATTTKATSLPACFANDVCAAANAHGAHSPVFARKRDRAFLAAYATDIEEVASALRRERITLQDALLCDEVQAALGIDVGLAAQQVLAVLRIIEPRTMQRLLASSRANATTP